MGLKGNFIKKCVSTVFGRFTSKKGGNGTSNVVASTTQKQVDKEDAVFKNGILYIKPPFAAEECFRRKAIDVALELLEAGFENITLEPVKILRASSAKKYGRIEDISINGNNDFLGIKRVPAASYIVIGYLDFKDGVNQEIYVKVKKIVPGTIRSASDIELIMPKNNDISTKCDSHIEDSSNP